MIFWLSNSATALVSVKLRQLRFSLLHGAGNTALSMVFVSPRTISKAATLRDSILFLLSLVAMLWLVLRGAGQMDYSWHWQRVPGYLFTLEEGRFIAGPLLQGLGMTLAITSISMVVAGLIGLLTALLRLSASPVGRGLSRIYLEIIRNTPLLVQIFCFYFIMAPILDIGRMTTAVLALSLFEGAYASEIFRAGILSIHRGQWEACHSLGLTRWQGYRHVILPQAIRRIMPPLTSQAISLIKDSSLVSTIAVYELTMQGRAIIADTYLSFEIWAVVACIYLVLTVSLSILANTLKRRVHGAT
ncbi:MAG: amino acid ABC transporter permease [Desulfobulbus sp.]|jgi:polar amino acid transport system permease protein